ncbi:MAG: hypothetical protein KDA33_08545 [Phycisphaerales bacterium]|nr:hypothetical protein [Phycisphaerales bacterium]
MSRARCGVCWVAAVFSGLIITSNVGADEADAPAGRFSTPALRVDTTDLPKIDVVIRPSLVTQSPGQPGAAPRGVCPPQVVTYSDQPFTGQITATFPPGMVEQEIAAATYTVPAENWPIVFRTADIVWGQTHLNSTTSASTLLIWEGTPDTGTLVDSFSSDDELIQHVHLPVGTSSVAVLSVTVDPGDPDQVILTNNGSNKFSVGFRIDAHNNPASSSCSEPCLGLGTLPSVCCPPDELSNAWPGMDAAGPGPFGSQQWLFARSCPGATGLCSLAVDPGWHLLSSFPLTGSNGQDLLNDWALQVTYETVNCVPPTGACCATDGTCDSLTSSTCQGLGGAYQGDNTECQNVSCPQPMGACCFMPSGCVNLTAANCSGAGGVWSGAGSLCATTICFASGACCMPDGSCQDDVLEGDCGSAGGLFQGNLTECATTSCPQPVGACCLTIGFCLDVIQADCNQIVDAVWYGLGTDCTDADMNSTADICENADPCDGVTPGDFNSDTLVNGADVQQFVSALLSGSPTQGDLCRGDFDTSGDLGVSDVPGMVAALLN